MMGHFGSWRPVACCADSGAAGEVGMPAQ
jgi:hypothetical protein